MQRSPKGRHFGGWWVRNRLAEPSIPGALRRSSGGSRTDRVPERFVAEVRGHPTRMATSQDLAALDIDLAAMASRGMEVDADAAAVCGEGQSGEFWDGEAAAETYVWPLS